MARIHDAPRHCNRRKQWASRLTELDVLFSVLALLDVSIGVIGLWLQCHSHAPMIRHHLWPLGANLDILSDVHVSLFLPKTSIKIAWHEPNVMPTSSATSPNSDSTIIQNHFLYCFNVFIGCWSVRATRASIVIDIFSAFLKPVIPQLNLCSPNSTVNMSNVLAHLISFFTQNLIEFLWSTHIHNWSSQAFNQDYWPSFSYHLYCMS